MRCVPKTVWSQVIKLLILTTNLDLIEIENFIYLVDIGHLLEYGRTVTLSEKFYYSIYGMSSHKVFVSEFCHRRFEQTLLNLGFDRMRTIIHDSKEIIDYAEFSSSDMKVIFKTLCKSNLSKQNNKIGVQDYIFKLITRKSVISNPVVEPRFVTINEVAKHLSNLALLSYLQNNSI